MTKVVISKRPPSFDEKIRLIDSFIADHIEVGHSPSTISDCEEVLHLAGKELEISDPDTVALLVERLEKHGAELVEDPASKEWYWSGIRLKPDRRKRSDFSVLLSCKECGARGQATISEKKQRNPGEDPNWMIKQISEGFIARNTDKSSWGLTILCKKCLTSAWR